MNQRVCQSILRLIGVMTVYLGSAWVLCFALSYQGLQPWLGSISEMSTKLARAAGKPLTENVESYLSGIYVWTLLGQLSVVGMGVLLIIWSRWIARLIAADGDPSEAPIQLPAK